MSSSGRHSANAIRQAFLDFFASKGHSVVASSSLVPHDDPTLLFTNAGMNQFKDCFLGLDKRAYTRAVTSQKCVRAGGKHNDLENVGYTARHHTFFEMLGNFSFGDYFKRDAIHYAWEFLTSAQWLNIPKDKLTVTVYATDDEAFALWRDEIGVPVERIIRIGDNKGAPYASDNFWAMGDTGPCGPCTEIFYDHGAQIWGGPPGSPEEDGDRFIEIWNNVFMQFNRTADGVLHPLPKPSVDTGMGLERISAVMQHVHANYEIDLFQNLLSAVTAVTGNSDEKNMSRRVIADHIRSCAFLIADGVLPSNEGRGYVLRRIIRRAIRHGNKLGVKNAFFYKLVAALVKEMGDAYPELKSQQAHIEKNLKSEEEQFARTLDNGMAVLEERLADLKNNTIPGEIIFLLYDTYGFPVDLTNDIARERNLTLDMAGYEQCMEEQRERARAAGKFGIDYNDSIKLDGETCFTGYDTLQDSSKVIALFKNGSAVNELAAGDEGVVVVDKTPFYAESGGQVGDTGLLQITGAQVSGGEFTVADTRKSGSNFLHIGKQNKGSLKIGSTLTAAVDRNKRQATANNHSATHLLHAALRKVLGTHVQQKGSLVDAEKLRFDFSHPQALTKAELRQIELLVNEQIAAASAVSTKVTNIEEAKQMGAMALFGEKYGDTVRVLAMGKGADAKDSFSVELCGGTHVNNTSDIGLFFIVSESGIASGVRRMEACTGAEAFKKAVTPIAETDPVKADAVKVIGLIRQGMDELSRQNELLLEQKKKLEKELQKQKAAQALSSSDDLLAQAQDINGIKVLVAHLQGADGNTLRTMVDQFKNKLGTAVVLLATVEADKVALVAGVTANATAKIKAGDLMKEVAPFVGGKGGGRPDMAQGGGADTAGIEKALSHARVWLHKQL